EGQAAGGGKANGGRALGLSGRGHRCLRPERVCELLPQLWLPRCYTITGTALEQWEEANAIFRARARRYPETVIEWYFVTRRYPKTDRASAEEAVHDYLAGIGNDFPPGIEFQAGRFRMLTGKIKEAQARFDSLFEKHKDRMVVLLS